MNDSQSLQEEEWELGYIWGEKKQQCWFSGARRRSNIFSLKIANELRASIDGSASWVVNHCGEPEVHVLLSANANVNAGLLQQFARNTFPTRDCSEATSDTQNQLATILH